MQKKLSFVPPVGTPNVPALNVAEQIQEMAQSLATNRMGTQRPDDIVDGEMWHKFNPTTQEIIPHLWRTSDGNGDGTIPGYVLHPNDADAHKELFENIQVFPEVDPALVGKALALVPQADGTFIWQEAGGGVPVGIEAWCSGTTPPPGWLDESRYHGQLPRAAYPDLWAFALASGNLLDDVSWQAQVDAQGSCGAFSTGDGAATFRIPLLRRVFPRARDVDGGLDVGMWQGDATRPVTGGLLPYASGAGTTSVDPVRTFGAFYWDGSAGSGSSVYANFGTSVTGRGDLKMDTGRVVPTADENRPVSIVRLPIIKAWDVATVPANLEVGELVNQIADIGDRVNSEAHIRDLAGNRVWTSAEYTPVLNSSTIVAHGIQGLNPSNARAEVWLKCVVAQNGYVPGDIIRNFSHRQPSTVVMVVSAVVLLTETEISTITGNYFQLPVKPGGGDGGSTTAANWRYIFKIWY